MKVMKHETKPQNIHYVEKEVSFFMTQEISGKFSKDGFLIY